MSAKKWAVAALLSCVAAWAAGPALAEDQWLVCWKGPKQAQRGEGGAEQAAGLLAGYMSRVLGTPVKTAEWPGSPATNTFLIAEAKHAPPDAAKKLDGKRLDAFVIEYPCALEGRQVCLLVGHDSKGCDFPAYYFLTNFMGVEWVGPGDIGQIVPKQPNWALPEKISILENPDYEHRAWNASISRNWLAGSYRLPFHHNLGNVFDPDKHRDPEMYPYYDGKHAMAR